MLSKEITIDAASRADARPAAMLVQVASQFESSIYIEQAEKKVNAKSIMGVMTLEFIKGVKVNAIVSGSDEAEAMNGIERFFNGN